MSLPRNSIIILNYSCGSAIIQMTCHVIFSVNLLKESVISYSVPARIRVQGMIKKIALDAITRHNYIPGQSLVLVQSEEQIVNY